LEVPPEISGFVLAGGRSSRLGRDKALLPWPPNAFAEGNRQTLLQHSIARLESVCATVSICANRDDLPFTGVILADALPGSGPLGGIVAALEHSTTPWNLLLAVDLPFLPAEVLQALVSRVRPIERSAASHDDSQPALLACILPDLDGFAQPLCGLYHRALAPGLRQALQAGKYKVMTALHAACDRANPAAEPGRDGPVFRVEMWDVAAYADALPSLTDPGEWFLNINTPQDWQQARQHPLK
jgi:molybdopterin-guanine dinucleotide biosynthesis protein A